MAKVVVMGLGYIGLPTAAMLALNGNDVLGVDIDPQVLKALRTGNVPVRERDLTAIVRDALQSRKLEVAEEPERSEYFLISVPTPRKGQEADLAAVRTVSRKLASYVRSGSTVILESTVPPGTTANAVRPLLEHSGRHAGIDFHLAYCPERVMPGNIIHEIVENDRVVGGINPASAQKAADLYATFVRGAIYQTDLATAEFVKLAENAYRDVNIAFSNELAELAEAHGVDIWKVVELANRHPRVKLLRPGPGVGGHCIAVDPWFLLTSKVSARVIPAARATNEAQPHRVVEQVLRALGDPKRARIAAFGVAYKGNVGDVRESPATAIVGELRQKGVSVAAYDPLVPHDLFSTVSLEEAIEGVDCILILSDHREFSYIDPSLVAAKVRRRLLIDTRNCVDHPKWLKSGFEVRLLGSPEVLKPRARIRSRKGPPASRRRVR